jgi:hypothetical protein
MYQRSRRKCRTVAEAMLNDNWIQDLMHNITAPLLVEYVLMWELVEASGFYHHDTTEDGITWTRSANGEYSAKSAYAMQFEGSIHSNFPSKVWRVWAPSQCKFFLWLMLQNTVWTVDRLLLREWPNQYFCPPCCWNLETAAHLFIECPVTRQIWLAIANWTSWPPFHPSNWAQDWSLKDWFGNLSGSSPSLAKAHRAQSLATLVDSWRERNARIF